MFEPLDLVSGVVVVLGGIKVLLVRSHGLVWLPPLASFRAIRYVFWLIVVPRILE